MATNLRKVRELFNAVDGLASHDRRLALATCDGETIVRDQVEKLVGMGAASTWHANSSASESQRATHDGFYEPGATIGEFEVVRLLGRGRSDVYLARQSSLDRLVALKIAPNVGGEARAMARLEHRHIVTVYSEMTDAAANTRLLCMKYIPGTTLAHVLERLRQRPSTAVCGATILTIVEERLSDELAFDESAGRDREELAGLSYEAAVCWIVARIAEALDFAHQRGVLHRDVKPANVLIDNSGRPYLTDFGLSAISTQGRSTQQDDRLGGTLAYMAPEHFDAFLTGDESKIAPQSDLYSLGVVLRELLAAPRPCENSADAGAVSAATATRCDSAGNRPTMATSASVRALDHILERCLASTPEKRLSNAGELARSLYGCSALVTARARLPRHERETRLIQHAPAWAALVLVVAGLAPHFVGNFICPAYNALILFPRLPTEKHSTLIAVAAIYGFVVFPLLAIGAVRQSWRIGLLWWQIRTGRSVDPGAAEAARRELLSRPFTAARLSLAGWLPLLVYVPAAMSAAGAGLRPLEYIHFAASVVLCLLILTPYTWFVLQFAVVRFAYPDFWIEANDFSAKASHELAPIAGQWRRFQIAACAGPLVACGVLLSTAPAGFAANSFLMLRVLALLLLAVAALGLWLGLRMGRLIQQSVDALST